MNNKWQKNGEKLGGVVGQKTGEKCKEIAMFPNRNFPFFPEAAVLPISTLYKTNYLLSGWKIGGNEGIRGYPKFEVPRRLASIQTKQQHREGLPTPLHRGPPSSATDAPVPLGPNARCGPISCPHADSSGSQWPFKDSQKPRALAFWC